MRTPDNGRSAREQQRFIDSLARHFIEHADETHRRIYKRMRRASPDTMAQVASAIDVLKRRPLS